MVSKLEGKKIFLPLILGVFFGVGYFKLPFNIFMALLLGFLSVILTLYDVRVGICLAVFSMPYLPFYLALVFMAFVVFVYFLKAIFKKMQPFTKHPVDLPVALFALIIFVSTITSINPKGSLRDLVFHLVSIAFIFILVNVVKSKNALNILLTILVITATFTALYGIYQYKMELKTLELWTDKETNPKIATRVFSFFENPNVLAEYLIMVIPISFALVWNSKKLYKKFLFSLMTLALIIGLGLTYSRGGWLGFLFGIFIFIILVEKKLFIPLAFLALLALPFLPSTILNRFKSIVDFADSSSSSRFGIWLVAINIIKDYWMAGIGLGSKAFKSAYSAYAGDNSIYYHAHNTYIETVVEMGVAGLIVLLMLLYTLYKYPIKRFINSKDRWMEVTVGGILSGLSGVLMHSLVDDLFFMPKIIITFWLLVSFLLVAVRIGKDEKGMECLKE